MHVSADKYVLDKEFLNSCTDNVLNPTSRYKAFRLIGLHPICAILFALGYVLREVGAYHYSWQTDVKGEVDTVNLIIYVISQVLIFVAP